MNMLRPTFRTDGGSSLKERKAIDLTMGAKHGLQHHPTGVTTPYKPQAHKLTHGIGLSLKNIENRQLPSLVFQPLESQQNIDGYLQKVIKTNLQKISQIRMEHQKEKDELLREIKTLKIENSQLKNRLEEEMGPLDVHWQRREKQLSSSLQKNIITKYGTQKTLRPNPQKSSEKKVFIDDITQKTSKLLEQIEDYKKRNAILSIQKRTLTSSIQRLQKEIQSKSNQVQQLRKNESSLFEELKAVKHEMDQLRKENEVDKMLLEREMQKINQIKERNRQKEKEKDKITSVYVMHHEINPKIINDPRITGYVDKRVVRHLQCQLKEKDIQGHQKDRLIEELNNKILSNGLASLNTKYKYLVVKV